MSVQISTAQTQKCTIFFDVNVTTLKPKSIVTLDSLIAFGDAIKVISIKGYADPRGSDSMNLLLSKWRSEQVANYLKKGNININVVNYFGEKFPSNQLSPENYSEWRKVEIEFDIDKSKQELTLDNLSIKSIEDNLSTVALRLEFYNNSDVFMEYSLPELEKLVQFLKNNPTVNAFIRGHVCCTNNFEISDLRAKAVVNFLISNKIDSKRISYQGFSNSMPLVWPEITDEDMQRNRRVDIVFSIQK